jgi:hypothetical protein
VFEDNDPRPVWTFQMAWLFLQVCWTGQTMFDADVLTTQNDLPMLGIEGTMPMRVSNDEEVSI